MKVLILGFSVLNGLVERFSGMEGSNHFAIRALGGNHFEVYPYLMEGLLQSEQPDLVLLDLVSTPRVPRWTHKVFNAATRFIVHKCHKYGAKVGFLNLYRADVDQETDFLHRAISEISGLIRAPVLDMLKEHRLAHDDLERIYPDGNHLSAEGRLVVGDMIVRFAEGSFAGQRTCPRPPEYIGLEPAAIKFDTCLREFKRFGFDERITSLQAENTKTFELPLGFRVEGALMLMGPRTGTVAIEYANSTASFQLYDQYCYYERLRHVTLRPAFSDFISFTQSSDMPNIDLLKSERDRSEREGGVFACLGVTPEVDSPTGQSQSLGYSVRSYSSIDSPEFRTPYAMSGNGSAGINSQSETETTMKKRMQKPNKLVIQETSSPLAEPFVSDESLDQVAISNEAARHFWISEMQDRDPTLTLDDAKEIWAKDINVVRQYRRIVWLAMSRLKQKGIHLIQSDKKTED